MCCIVMTKGYSKSKKVLCCNDESAQEEIRMFYILVTKVCTGGTNKIAAL